MLSAYPYTTGPFRFPRDEGHHPEFREEWWYFQSHFTSQEGERFAFVVSYINQAYRISALIEVDRPGYNRFIYPPDQFGDLKKAEYHHDIRQGASYWRQTGGAFNYILHEEMATREGRFGSLHLRLSAEKPPIPIGGGVVEMGRNGRTYWYALTRIRISGTISVGDESRRVKGMGWIDRQWGNWNWMGFEGWKWFAVHLDDGRDVVAYQTYEPISKRPITKLCQVVARDGSHRIWKELQVTDLDTWTSPETNEVYTYGWQISSNPAGLKLELLPAMHEQEVHRGLWEGSCVAEGQLNGERVSGPAFVELVTARPAPTTIRYLSYVKAIGMGIFKRTKRGSLI